MAIVVRTASLASTEKKDTAKFQTGLNIGPQGPLISTEANDSASGGIFIYSTPKQYRKLSPPADPNSYFEYLEQNLRSLEATLNDVNRYNLELQSYLIRLQIKTGG